ncbi:hypothetical protein [Pseudomonas monsensis]
MPQLTDGSEIAQHAAHLVAADFVLSGTRRVTTEARTLAAQYSAFCHESLEKAGYLPKHADVREHPPGTPHHVTVLGKPVFIPHKDGLMLEVDLGICQKIFQSTYRDAWL